MSLETVNDDIGVGQLKLRYPGMKLWLYLAHSQEMSTGEMFSNLACRKLGFSHGNVSK